MKSYIENMYDSLNPPKWAVKAALGVICAGGVGFALYRYSVKTSTGERGTGLKASHSNGLQKGNDSSSEVDAGEEMSQLQGNGNFATLEERLIYLKNSGNMFYQKKQFNDALNLYSEALSLIGEEPSQLKAILYQNRAAVYDTQGNLESALLDLNKANELDLKYIKARKRRAKICLRLGDYKQAVEDYIVAAFAEDFKENSTLIYADRALEKFGEAEAQKNSHKRKSLCSARRVFRTCYNSFCFDPVISSLKDYKPVSQPTGLDEVKAALIKEDYMEVGIICKKYLNTYPEPSSANLDEWLQICLVLGTYHLFSIELTEALNMFEKIISAPSFGPPSRIETLCRVAGQSRRGNVWLQTQEFAKVEEDFQRALDMDDKNGDVYHLHGQYLLMTQNLEGAYEDFKKAYQLSGKTNDIVGAHVYFTLFRIGMMTMSHEKVNKARENLIAICQRCEKFCEPDSLLALTYMETQSFELAEKHFMIANQKDPEDATVLTHRGLAELQRNGHTPAAVGYLEQAIAVDPNLELAYETLATVEIQRGNLDKAIELFEKAEVLTHSNAEMAHVIALKTAAEIQLKLSKQIDLPNLNQFAFFRQSMSSRLG